jgi:hypothetical protein
MKANPQTYILTTEYGSYEVYLSFGTYRNGRTAIELLDSQDHEPVMVATVNIDNALLHGDEIIIKDYSENEGVLDFLVKNGITSRPKHWISSGWVTCPVVDLLVKP